MENTLRQALDASGFASLIARVCDADDQDDPWPRLERAGTLGDDLTESQRVLSDLFILGNPVDRRALGVAVTEPVVEHLCRNGILTSLPTGRIISRFGVVSHENRYFFASWPAEHPRSSKRARQVYFGKDSIKLARHLPIETLARRVLDLCCGSGIQGIMLAKEGVQICFVDRNPLAVKVAMTNARLNGIRTDATRFHVGSLYRPLRSEDPFDLIVMNPPFLATPRAGLLELAGDGGPLGLRVIIPALYGLGQHLAKDGQFKMLAGLLGDAEPFLFKSLTRSFRKNFEISCHVLNRLPTIEHAFSMAHYIRQRNGQDIGQNFSDFLSHYDRCKAHWIYNCVVTIRRKVH